MLNPEQHYEKVTHLEFASLSEHRVKRIIKLANTLKAENLLDIGCGDGVVTIAVAQALRATKIYGVDISPKLVEKALKNGVLASVLNLSAAPLPFNDNSFDFVICTDVLEHLFDPDFVIKEIYRVLKPTGFAIISTPNLAAWHERFSLLFGFQPESTAASMYYGFIGKLFAKNPEGAGEHIRVPTFRALKQLLKIHNFNVVKVMGAWGKDYPKTLPVPFRVVYRGINAACLLRPSLAPCMIFLVKKKITEL